MRALLAERESDGLALLELPDASGGAKGRPAGEDDHELLVGVMEVVRIGRLAGRDLEQARSDQLGTELVADPCPPRAETLGFLPLLEAGVVDARHALSLVEGG